MAAPPHEHRQADLRLSVCVCKTKVSKQQSSVTMAKGHSIVCLQSNYGPFVMLRLK